MKTNIRFKPSGLYAALVTPMHDDGRLNLAVIPQLVKVLKSQGVAGLFVAGTTGEGRQLQNAERRDLLKAVMDADAGLPVIAHVGHESQLCAQALAEDAAQRGVDAISVAPPSYHRINSLDGLLDFYAPIVNAVPMLPVFHYHIPCLTGCEVRASDFLAAANNLFPNIAGIKFTDERMMDFQQCLNICRDDQTIGFGRDEQLLASLIYGSTWAIGSSYNIAAPLYMKIIEAFGAGDFERAQSGQFVAVRLIQLLQAGGHVLSGIKAILTAQGTDCGPVRAPLRNVNQQQSKQLVTKCRSLLAEFIPNPEGSHV